jgi:hypothetical protein
MSARAAASFALCCLALAGCAVGGGTLRAVADRTFDLAAADAIRPGMDEPAVVAALGLPASFGVDDRGRRYLQYTLHALSLRMFGAGTGPVGMNGTVVNSATTGFDLRVFIEDGRVSRIARRVFQDDPGPAVAAAEHGPR